MVASATKSAMATAPRTSLAQEVNYSTGEPALRLDDFGCGFC